MSSLQLTTPIQELLKSEASAGIFNESDTTEMEISPEDYYNAIENVKQRISVRLKSGKYSDVFIQQLARHILGIGEKFGSKIHYYHAQSIIDMIEHFETEKFQPKPFNRQPLQGLWHIHHDQTTFRKENITNYWKRLALEQQNRKLNEVYAELKKSHGEEFATKNALRVLLNRTLYQVIFKEIKKQTGEWVVFANKNGINYYLCLGTHEEEDADVWSRLLPCFQQFPELQSQV